MSKNLSQKVCYYLWETICALRCPLKTFLDGLCNFQNPKPKSDPGSSTNDITLET